MKYIFIILFTTGIFAQGQFSTFVNRLYVLQDSVQKAAVIDSFYIYARTQGIPFIEGNQANFMYRANKSTVQIAGDFTSWNPTISMTKVPGTNFFYHSRTFEMNARLDYKFVADGAWILDPENPHRVSGGFGPNSELAMPAYIQPWEIVVNPNIPHGTLIYKNIFSTNTSSNYNVTVYLPPGYDSLSAEGYPSAYFQDGNEYVNLGSTNVVMDNLIHTDKIKPVIGVFVQPNNREAEYAAAKRNQYRLFFVNELVPFIDSLYNTVKNPQSRIVTGDSWGGNISALISYNHPDVFGNCGLHSGAFQPNSYEAYNLIVNGPEREIRFASIWGTYESLFTNLRNFRDSLLSKGYDLTWLELPEGHSWGLWRATTDIILQYFIPGPAASAENYPLLAEQDYYLYQNYPNPFNPSTEILFSLNKNSSVIIKIFNSIGQEVGNIADGEFTKGIHKLIFSGKNLPSGVYYYRLISDNYSVTRKMLLVK